MKVGIFTFHSAHNYGAVLQAYALQTYLKSKGLEVHVIDYCPETIKSFYKPFGISDFRSFKTMLSRLLLFPASWKRYRNFDRFIHEKLSLDKLDLDCESCAYETFIYGSDQIWSPKILRGFDAVYFAGFEAAKGKRNISYAASMGKNTLDSMEKNYCKEALERFNAISVREDSLKRTLSPLTKKNIEVVLDPTFMLTPSQWDQIAVNPPIKSPYVLVYQVEKNEQVYKIAHSIAKQIQGNVIELKSKLSLLHQSKYQCASPEEFIGLFRHASFVVTTSFHGTAFSILFNRPFYTVKVNENIDTRASALLNRLSLSGRLIQNEFEAILLEIDYTTPNKLLASLQESSKSFLEKALKLA